MTDKFTFSVNSGAWGRYDTPAELEIDLNPFDLDRHALYLIEEDKQGNVIDNAVPFQINQENDHTSITLLLMGHTPPNTQRSYALVKPADMAEVTPLVTCTDGVEHQEQESYHIETPAATYFYHKFGAGFASIIDPDGNDWLSYRPYGGSDGKYRGIPNLAYPENHFHPGGTGCTSEIISNGPIKLKIASESTDGKWACTWEIFPAFARLTVLKVDHPYWFLYEGTPGGKLNEASDYCVRSDGTRLPLTQTWELPLPAPEWIYFGASNTQRVLYFVHHEADDHIDSFWPMEHNMTVFGFGRNGLEKFMTAIPSQFTVGFAEDGTFEAAQKVIDAAFRPLRIT